MCSKLKLGALTLGLLVFAILPLVGCLATRQEIRDTVKGEPPTQEQQVNANNEIRYRDLEEENRRLLGRIETLENSVNMLSADKTGARTEQAAAQKSTTEKLKILEEAVGKLENENAALLAKVEALKVSHATAEASAKESHEAKSESKKGAFDLAENEFQKKKYKESIVLFQKYRETNPAGKKYPEATYKIGVAFHELGMKSDAKAFYSEVTEKFPKSDWAKKATAKIKVLK